MANKRAPHAKNDKKNASQGEPRALAFSEKGVASGADFANVMSALMGDLIAGRITPQIGNAVCNVGGKLLKIVEMQHRYGTAGAAGSCKTIELAKPKALTGQ